MNESRRVKVIIAEQLACQKKLWSAARAVRPARATEATPALAMAPPISFISTPQPVPPSDHSEAPVSRAVQF